MLATSRIVLIIANNSVRVFSLLSRFFWTSWGTWEGDISLKKIKLSKNQKDTWKKYRWDELWVVCKDDYKYKRSLSELSLKSEGEFLFHVTALFNHFLLLANFLSLLRYHFLSDAIVLVFTTVLFLTQMPTNFSLWKEFTSLSTYVQVGAYFLNHCSNILKAFAFSSLENTPPRLFSLRNERSF